MVITMWARIEGDRVAEITDIDPEGRFHPSLVWVPCGAEVRSGWTYEAETHTFTPTADEVSSLRELAATAMAQVNAEYTRRMGAIADDYPLHERESWPVQLQEARELQSNPDAVTPWIELCAAQRGLTREELAGRIVAKDLAYREVSGFLTGVRQRHEDEIDALLEAGEASREALQDYHWAEYWDGEEPEQTEEGEGDVE